MNRPGESPEAWLRFDRATKRLDELLLDVTPVRYERWVRDTAAQLVADLAGHPLVQMTAEAHEHLDFGPRYQGHLIVDIAIPFYRDRHPANFDPETPDRVQQRVARVLMPTHNSDDSYVAQLVIEEQLRDALLPPEPETAGRRLWFAVLDSTDLRMLLDAESVNRYRATGWHVIGPYVEPAV